MSGETVEGAGVALACTRRGDGPSVLLVHDLAADAAAMAPVADALAGQACVIAYDRRGYGGSGAPEPYEATTVNEQAEDAAALLRAFGAAPAVVAGEGIGALVALDLLARHGSLVRAAVLADPPLLAFVPEATEALSAVRAVLEEALREAGPEHAVERWLGPGADPERVARARASHRAFFADFAGLTSWPVTRTRLRAIAAPTVVLTGPGTRPEVARAADALGELLSAARRRSDGDLAGAVRQVL